MISIFRRSCSNAVCRSSFCSRSSKTASFTVTVPGRTLSIRVQAEHRDDSLRFTVTDDGAGIPAGRLAELRESFEHDLTNEYAAHVGLYNIQKVIRLTYGAPYGVQIESTEGQGTAVTLTIPYEVEENEGC